MLGSTRSKSGKRRTLKGKEKDVPLLYVKQSEPFLLEVLDICGYGYYGELYAAPSLI